jgi:hypothetical protein
MVGLYGSMMSLHGSTVNLQGSKVNPSIALLRASTEPGFSF